MRIAVISDTHDSYPPDLPERLKGADEIWHLGDVCTPDVLVEFEHLGVPVFAVRGNCDPELGWPLTRNLEREGVKFHLVHIPPSQAPAGAQVLLHGHTHVPRDEMVAGVRWLNPGCISRPRATPSSFGWLTVAKGRVTKWEIVHV